MSKTSLTLTHLSRKLAIAGVCFGLSCIAPLAVQAEDIKTPMMTALQDTIVVEDHVITLADLFGAALPKGFAQATYPVLQAPDPGRELRITGGRLTQLARQYNIPFDASLSQLSVTVKRNGLELDEAFVEGLVKSELENEGYDGTYMLRLRGLQKGIYIPTNRAMEESYISDFTKRDDSDTFSASLNIPEGSNNFSKVRIYGTAAKMVRIPVLNSNILRDEVITKRHITYKEVNVKRLRDSVIDERELIGMAAVRTLRADSMIRSSDLQPPLVIRKGDEVYVDLKAGALTIQMRATATEDGAVGETISIANMNNGSILRAVVTGHKKVRVNPAGSLRVASR